jgi:hypothetical protein
MSARHCLAAVAAAVILVVTPASTRAQTPEEADAKITGAVSAGPPAITADATVMDWATEEGGEMTELRSGTNGWICLPDMPQTPGYDPHCVDSTFLDFMKAWSNREKPEGDTIGIGYMMQGGSEASNTDPFATEPAPGADWMRTPPHIMVTVPDAAALEGLPTDPETGGPWVMWAGTPYAHIMIPVGEVEEGAR